jgi:hypothetical protein
MAIATSTLIAGGLAAGVLYKQHRDAQKMKQEMTKLAPPVMPEAPEKEDLSSVTKAKKRRRTMATGASGRASTLLTGPRGLTNQPTAAPKTLLGR